MHPFLDSDGWLCGADIWYRYMTAGFFFCTIFVSASVCVFDSSLFLNGWLFCCFFPWRVCIYCCLILFRFFFSLLFIHVVKDRCDF
ncbi:hypothetical protein BJ508DRAFT_133403 [Ascobolus immersus RN42]|uniref:Uncharacterized protein n=1 Tax=Ascobolus immersus RN42 TaxID=1160509 RepID=A0A3N4IKK5_ASCIM|nr:hypothetical protein BJ508DRAFT_133403 [Ascobolus immersus RN42]